MSENGLRRPLRNSRSYRLFTLLAAGFTVFGASAFAQTEDQNDGEVAVGGERILTVRFADSGMTIKERADAINERLRNILSDSSLKPADIVAVPLGKTAAKITVKNQLLVTVDAKTARYNQTKPLALAEVWAAHLRRILPKINVKPNVNTGAPQDSNDGGAPSVPGS